MSNSLLNMDFSTDTGTTPENTTLDTTNANVETTGATGTTEATTNPDTTATTDSQDWFKKDKFKTPEEQAKAYVELEKKFGGFTGAPEQYTVDKIDGVELNDETLKAAMATAKELNMSNEAFNIFVTSVVNNIAKQDQVKAQDAETIRQAEIDSLGPDGKEQIKDLQTWLKNQGLTDEEMDTMANMAIGATEIRLLNKIRAKVVSTMAQGQPAVIPNNTVSEFSNYEGGSERYTAMLQDKRYRTDKDFTAMTDKYGREVLGKM